jgi:SAM-dependent methyltransferase
MPSEIPEPVVKKEWDRNAESWADQVRRGYDTAREYWNNPAFLEFVGDIAGKRVLDAGCGEGYNTRIFERRGARMTGVDLSGRMIELARGEENREPLGIRYELGSYCDLSMFADESFDACVSTMALMDGPDFPRAMQEIARVIKPGGFVAYSILHPCFATKGFGWVDDENGRALKFKVAEYFNGASWIEQWKFGHAPGADDRENFSVPRFDRTLAYYINSTISAGLRLDAIAEPRVSASACALFANLQKFRDHVPLFLHVRAIKPRS